MDIQIKTYLLKGFDKEQTQRIEKIIQYISQKNNIHNQINLIDKLDIELESGDYLIIFCDELIVNQLNQDKINQQFFTNRRFRSNQVIIVLDEILPDSIPDYMHLLPVFSLNMQNQLTSDEDTEWEEIEKSPPNLIEVINDTILFIKRSKQAKNDERLTIYIGPFDDNTTYEYQKLTRELLCRDYNVIPEISNPSAKELLDNKDYLNEMLLSSDLAIHFIGHQSLLQHPAKTSAAIKINSIVADFCKTPEGQNLSRIIYVPAEKDDSPTLLEQKISQFKNNIHSLTNAELIQTPVEKFKEIVLEKIQELSLPLAQRNSDSDGESDVYFIYPPKYENEVKGYIEWFNKNNINYKVSQANLDQLKLLHYHQKQLAQCKKVLIYNPGNQQWFNRKISDIIKSPGWGRDHNFELIAVCGKKTDTKDLKLLSNYKTIIIDDNGIPNNIELTKFFS
jgi:hypothetical protein